MSRTHIGLVLVAGLIGALCAVGLSGHDRRAPGRPVSASTRPVASQVRVAVPPPAAPFALPPAMPTRLRIPTLSIDAPIEPSGVNPDGTLEVPPFSHPEQVDWDTATPAPGTRGAAVLLGHLDTWNGLAVFAYLRTIRPGGLVEVDRDDGSVATFTVDEVAQYPKDQVPGDEIYDDPGYPALRLITCGGAFDKSTREYEDNIVVYARLQGRTSR